MTATLPATDSTPELLSVEEAYTVAPTGTPRWQGACHGLPVAEVDRLFWSDQPSSSVAYRDATEQARSICAGCAHVGDCRRAFQAQGADLGGVWFATTPAMRDQAREHGLEPTRRGELTHYRGQALPRSRIVALLNTAGPLPAPAIAEALCLDPRLVHKTAQRLIDDGQLRRDAGRYAPTTPPRPFRSRSRGLGLEVGP